MRQQTEHINPDHLAQRANQLFVENGLTCGEACLRSAAEAMGIESPLLPGIAIALGGGLGVQGDVCGAVTGCALALSLAAAGKTQDYAERKKLAMPAMGRLYQAFAERCGAVRCVSMAPAFRGLVRAACRFRLPRAICAACASRQAVEP